MTDWRDIAACRGDNPSRWVWISRKPRLDRMNADTLKAICAACPVCADCLADELAVMRHGITSLGVRGGTTPEERHELLEQRRARAPRQPTHTWDDTAPGADLLRALIGEAS